MHSTNPWYLLTYLLTLLMIIFSAISVICLFVDNIERWVSQVADSRVIQMYVKRSTNHHHHHHNDSISSSKSHITSPTPSTHTAIASNPVVLQAPVVQHIRASSCRGNTATTGRANTGNGNGGSGQSAVLGVGVTRNETHPLARMAATVSQDIEVNEPVMHPTVTEASLWNLYIRHLHFTVLWWCLLLRSGTDLISLLIFVLFLLLLGRPLQKSI